MGPTRFAESSTSMPPPEPRSSTVSPGSSSASAVGLPQPSEASSACSGTLERLRRVVEVRGDRIAAARAAAGEQQPLPLPARFAASAYLSRTTSLIVRVAHGSSSHDGASAAGAFRTSRACC